MNKKEHQHAASHHTKVAEEFHKLAEHADTVPGHKPMFKALACHHDAAAEHHLAACKATSDELEKADGNELAEVLRDLKKFLGNTVVPSNVRAIPPSDRPAPRYGQPDVKKVDPVLRGIVADPSETEPPSVEFTSAGAQ